MRRSLSFALFTITTTTTIPSCHHGGLFIHGFSPTRYTHPKHYYYNKNGGTIVLQARYGPPMPFDKDQDMDDALQQNENIKIAFQQLIEQIMMISEPEHIPSILGTNIELVISVDRNTVQTILDDAKESGGEALEEQVATTIDMILGFAEAFVEQLKRLDDGNKQLLGKIIRTMSGRSKNDDSSSTATTTTTLTSKEDALDDLLEQEKEHFTPGFLRHIEGECERIVNAPTTTPESLRLLEMLRTIQARVVEELGKEMGEAALVLGQLLAYDNQKERMAVLQAGLTVRGMDFAKEMSAMTNKALDDFQLMDADPELVERVQGIHQGLNEYLQKGKS